VPPGERHVPGCSGEEDEALAVQEEEAPPEEDALARRGHAWRRHQGRRP
jgi:hypothetical protein